MGVWGGWVYGVLGTPRHTILHLHPQATTFLSPPGGIYLIDKLCFPTKVSQVTITEGLISKDDDGAVGAAVNLSLKTLNQLNDLSESKGAPVAAS
jgi:hypothetical protein